MLSWADCSFLPVRLARAIAASICLRSARVSLRRGLVCGSAGSACRFVFAANNVIHLLVEICLPLQHGIEVVGAVGALLGPDDGHLEDVSDDLFQGLAVFFIHRQHEEGQHDEHHAHGRHAVASRTPEQKEKRHADERPAAEADKLPLG